MQEPDRTLQAGRRYILGQAEDFYGIWDREYPGKAVETFELTEAGLGHARRRISKLAAHDFWARIGPKALRWGLFGGLAVWILTGLVLSIRHAVGSTPGPGPTPLLPADLITPFDPGWVKVVQVAEDVAFRVWIAAVAIIVALRLFDRGRQPV
jgi:hypothetical protein